MFQRVCASCQERPPRGRGRRDVERVFCGECIAKLHIPVGKAQSLAGGYRVVKSPLDDLGLPQFPEYGDWIDIRSMKATLAHGYFPNDLVFEAKVTGAYFIIKGVEGTRQWMIKTTKGLVKTNGSRVKGRVRSLC